MLKTTTHAPSDCPRLTQLDHRVVSDASPTLVSGWMASLRLGYFHINSKHV